MQHLLGMHISQSGTDLLDNLVIYAPLMSALGQKIFQSPAIYPLHLDAGTQVGMGLERIILADITVAQGITDLKLFEKEPFIQWISPAFLLKTLENPETPSPVKLPDL